MTNMPTGTNEEWSPFAIRDQIRKIASAVVEERYAQEDRWGPQNVFDLQPGSDGESEIGRSYRTMAKAMKHQCELAREEGRLSLDLILLEEVFEALEAAVCLAYADGEDRDRLRECLIAELIQVSAVAEKWAAITERDEPRHG